MRSYSSTIGLNTSEEEGSGTTAQDLVPKALFLELNESFKYVTINDRVPETKLAFPPLR